MEHLKLQAGCLIIVIYTGIIYLRECHAYKIDRKKSFFIKMMVTGVIEILFDGATAYAVNHLDTIPSTVNLLLHLGFLSAIDVLVFMVFLYMLSISGSTPKGKRKNLLLFTPLTLNLIVVCCNIFSLEYIHGNLSNYSGGVSVNTCYVMVAVYMTASLMIYLRQWHSIEIRKRISIITCQGGIIIVSIVQMLMPDLLITSIVPALVVISAYVNQENPAFSKLEKYHNEMVMGFATLVENRDRSTGGHIIRTTSYVEMLAKELQKRGIYRETLTRDYIKNLIKAAPMHDVGKIAIPDAILQKPGKLSAEEFDIMKTHAEKGGKIIRDTFSHLGEEQYVEIAYQVARYHHEKWNGKGYPEGLKRKEIPLCARIMAVADVFDAVSAKRCYRDAMPLEKCYQIILEGSGQEFDPIIADVFLDMKDQVERVYHEKNDRELMEEERRT